MSRVDKGGVATLRMQPDRTIVEKNDGTLEGNITFKGDADALLVEIGDDHPDDTRLECYNVTTTYNSNGLITLNCSYFGLISSQTDPIVTYSGGQNNEAIETHPDFETILAGTVTAPLNGAKFNTTDPDNYGSFIEFQGGVDDTNIPPFRGTEYYLTPSTMVTLSYWQDKVPRLNNRLTIFSKIPSIGSRDFKQPDDVVDWLLLDTPYRQVGSFYQVTEQYLGSGRGGWNNKIYKPKNAQ